VILSDSIQFIKGAVFGVNVAQAQCVYHLQRFQQLIN